MVVEVTEPKGARGGLRGRRGALVMEGEVELLTMDPQDRNPLTTVRQGKLRYMGQILENGRRKNVTESDPYVTI